MNNLRQNIDIKNSLQTTVFITPQMKQSISMLQMPIQELSQEISTILAENPILEIGEDYDDTDNEMSDYRDNSDELNDKDPEKNNKIDDIVESVSSDEWDKYIGYEKKDDISYKPMNDENELNYEQFISSPITLYEHLLYQLKLSNLNPDQKKIGEYIIGNLTEEGYFLLDKDETANELGVSNAQLEAVLAVVKSFDPAGIGSENLVECLITQMKHNGHEDVYIEFAKEILEKYQTELVSFKYEEIASDMSIELDTFDYILELIKKTDPKPGLNFSSSEKQYIIPDVYIISNEDKFDIVLNESGLPPVKLNNLYTKMLKNSDIDEDSRQYIKDKVKSAIWIIDSLQKRQKAIYKVVKAITECQIEFLKNGINSIKPLKLKDIANMTELHESTVSRATSGKYAMTSHGLIELKSFFTKSIDDGDTSTSVIKGKLKELIEKENIEEPLSDQRLVELMELQGMKIARRTVAKYRDEMNIPTMSQRKRLRR